MTGLPAREGSSSTSTDAKNASMSTCRMVGRAGRSATEGQPAEPLGVGDAGRPALLAGELGPMALDCGRLGLNGVRDVHPFVRLEGRREEHRGNLVRRPGV